MYVIIENCLIYSNIQCRACGTRALGLLLSLIDQTDVTGQQFGPLYEDSINILINIANGNDSMKVSRNLFYIKQSFEIKLKKLFSVIESLEQL